MWQLFVLLIVYLFIKYTYRKQHKIFDNYKHSKTKSCWKHKIELLHALNYKKIFHSIEKQSPYYRKVQGYFVKQEEAS